MQGFYTMSVGELKDVKTQLEIKYNEFKEKKFKYDMSRGKPGPDQLDLSMELLNHFDTYKAADGTDTRNYGGIDGLPEARRLFADMLEVSPREVIVGGNSSLNMMYDAVVRAMLLGVAGGEVPWGKLPAVKFLCPSPGYDRHFAISQQLGIEMIVVDMKEDGPDMDAVEKWAAEDESVKGIWCVPKYSNPEGITYSDSVVDRFARMKTKAKDFRIFWDNAYTMHHLYDEGDVLKNLLTACKQAGCPDRVFIFGSTSKITLSGAGIAVMAASENNINHIKRQLSIQTIGPDKVNQLRHVQFLRNMESMKEHMQKHAAILRPKFEAVLDILTAELEGKDIAWWNKPRGGYFISLNLLDGCAKKVVAMAAEAGVIFTPAGASYPYGRDPRDRSIRIAPTFPKLEELRTAIQVLCVCVQLAAIEKIVAEKA